MTDRDEKLIEFYEDRVRQRAMVVAENLRDIADRIDRDVKNAGVDAISFGVTHEVWGVANCGLDTLAENYRNLVVLRRAAVATNPEVAS